MATSVKYLLVASTDAYSGKSATILGIGQELKACGVGVAYAKPLGTSFSENSPEVAEDDVRFIGETLSLSPQQLGYPILALNETTVNGRLGGEDLTDYSQSLQTQLEAVKGELILIEGPGNLWEGSLFNVSVEEMAQSLEARVLLVTRYNSLSLADALLSAKGKLGDRLLGVLINDVSEEQFNLVRHRLKPYLERQGIEVLGILPRNRLLRSVSVREIARQLKAQVLTRRDRLDLMVESLTIGAMNVNSALEYFRQRENMAVITGSDRTDLQLAALETSTNCLILTGRVPPQSLILSRAEDLEIPILSVDLDTLTTVEIVDRTFGTVRLQEPIKVQCIQKLIQENFALDRLINKLEIELSVLA